MFSVLCLIIVNTSSLPHNIPELQKIVLLYSKNLEKSNATIQDQTERIKKSDATIQGQIEQIKKSNVTIQDQTEQIKKKDKAILILEEEVKLLRKLRFAHKSEKWTKKDNLQALLFDEADVNSQTTEEEKDSSETITVTYTRKKKVGRRQLDPSLPRREVLHDLSEPEKQCSCGHAMEEVDRDHREELDMQPAKYWVNRHVYPQYACKHCAMIPDDTAPQIKSAPRKALISKSFASPGLLAHLLTSKFEDHLPFYRMERVLSRLSVTLPRATMCNWVIMIQRQLEPVLSYMQKDMLESKLIGADETTLQVMKEPGRKNTSKSYMWLFRGEFKERPVLLYQYHPTRSGDVPSNFLKGFKGHLLTDGYSGYSESGASPGIIHCGCWAHVRRKFKDAHDISETKNTRTALGLIGSLYQIEKQIRLSGMGLEKILALRREKSKPIVADFKKFLLTLNVLPKGLLGRAVSYALNQWGRLTVFLDVPFVPIDNNRIENDIRPFVLGRKNWLFSGSPRGAYASCAIYSLIRTARANGLDPYCYLRYLFEQLVTIEDKRELEKLAPHRIDPARVPAMV